MGLISPRMKKKDKILVIGEAFYPEEFLINDLVKEWEAEGYKLEVLTRSPSYPFGKVYKGYKNKLYQKERWGDILIHRFPVIQGYHKSNLIKVLNYLSFVVFGCIVALFIGRRYNKIFIYHTGPLSLAIPGILIHKLFRIPVTIWSFDLWPATVYAFGFKKTKALSWFLDNLVRWVYKNCDNIIVSSAGFVPEVKKYAPEKEIHIAPNWPQTLNIEKQKSSITLLPEKFHFTFTGNVGKVQNLENVLLGFEKAALNNAQLNIIGDGSHLNYLKCLAEQRVIKNVVFWGRIPVTEIMDVLDQSSVLIISLQPDPVMELTLPLKFQTYLPAHKPIFAVMKGEVRNMVEKYEIGKAVVPTDIEAISSGFEWFLKNEINVSQQSDYLLKEIFNRGKIISNISSMFFGHNIRN